MRLRRSVAGLLAGVCLGAVACSSVTNGKASPGSDSAGSHAPSQTSTDSTSSPSTATTAPNTTTTAPSTSPSSTQKPLRTITVKGIDPDYPGPFTMTLWATDLLAGNCAAHAYGKVATYFGQHECSRAGRYLWTFPYGGRTVALTIETVFAALGPSSDIYKWASELVRLENADGTGSINDLLREGSRIPGVAASIPAKEAFSVQYQDTGVSVFDAWYATGATTSQDATLIGIERSLFLTEASSLGL